MKEDAVWGQVFDRLTDGVCITEPSGSILYMNAAARKLLGLDKDGRGKILCDLLCANLAAPGRRDCASTCSLRDPEFMRPGVAYQGHYLGDHGSPVAKGLRVRCLRMPAGAILGENDNHLVLIEEALPGHGSKLFWEEGDPLTAQDLHAALATVFSAFRELSELPLGHAIQEGDKRLLGLGLGACVQLLRMVELYREVLKLEEGLSSLKRERVSLDHLIHKAVEKAEPLALERQVGIGVEAPEGLYVLADAGLLARVLDDLLMNGIRTVPAGGRMTITAARLAGNKVRFCFEDTGPGMAPEKLAEIFDRLYQARALKEERRQGLGLRWLFCRRAIRAMGGRFEMESDPESGNQILIDLPVVA